VIAQLILIDKLLEAKNASLVVMSTAISAIDAQPQNVLGVLDLN